MTLEQKNAKVLLQGFYARADARNADSERVSSMTKVQVLRNGKRLDQRREGNARP